MATLRNRPNAQLMLPRDENADAVGKVGSKVGSGGLGGKGLLQQQQSKSIDRPRKLLGDITNVKNVQPYSVSKAETPKPGSSKTAISGSDIVVGKDGGKPSSSAKLPRFPLRNITNSVKGASPREPDTSGKQKPPVFSRQPDTSNPGLKVQRSVGLEDLNAKIQRWAEEGIEKVHFAAEDMDSLRQEIQNQEIEKRVSKVIAYRTDLPRLWHPPTEINDLRTLDVLELDHIPDPQFPTCAGSGDDQHMELTASKCDNMFTSIDCCSNDLLARHLSWDTIDLSVKDPNSNGS